MKCLNRFRCHQGLAYTWISKAEQRLACVNGAGPPLEFRACDEVSSNTCGMLGDACLEHVGVVVIAYLVQQRPKSFFIHGLDQLYCVRFDPPRRCHHSCDLRA